MKIPDRLRRSFRDVGAGQVIAFVLVMAILAVGSGIAWCLWGWLQGGGDAESNGETLRNVSIMLGAVVALVFAFWRSWVAERQANTARRSLAYERFQKGVEMIGSPVLSVRLGGIYALDHLAEGWWGHHVQVMRVLCAFVRNPPHDHDAPRPDVQDAISVIGRRRTKDRIRREKASKYRPDLSQANLRGLKMGRMKFSRCNFKGADLSGATLTGCDLSGAWLDEAILRGATLNGASLEKATLTGADLAGVKSAVSANFTNASMQSADLSYANLQGAEFRHATLDGVDLTGTVFIEGALEAKGLTQKQIDSAKPLANDPTIPTISSLLDPDTGHFIRWKKSR